MYEDYLDRQDCNNKECDADGEYVINGRFYCERHFDLATERSVDYLLGK